MPSRRAATRSSRGDAGSIDGDGCGESRTVVTSPILVEVWRGSRVESIHRGRVVVVGAGDRVELSLGDVDSPVFWRSAAKPLQTAALLKAGTAERFGLEAPDLALITASHNGEDVHADRAAELLRRAGATEADLACGAHPSINGKVGFALAARGVAPTRLRSNCSGKHAGMLLFARTLGADLRGYTDPRHPVQVRIRDALAAIAELPAGEIPEPAIDGCSAPTYAMSLSRLAVAFRNLATAGTAAAGATGYEPELARVRDAMTAHPHLVAGSNRIDTDLMTTLGGRVVSKIGAEGVMAIGVRASGLGIAIKCDDGASRGYEPLAIELLARFGVLDAPDAAALSSYRAARLSNFSGVEIGSTRVCLP